MCGWSARRSDADGGTASPPPRRAASSRAGVAGRRARASPGMLVRSCACRCSPRPSRDEPDWLRGRGSSARIACAGRSLLVDPAVKPDCGGAAAATISPMSRRRWPDNRRIVLATRSRISRARSITPLLARWRWPATVSSVRVDGGAARGDGPLTASMSGRSLGTRPSAYARVLLDLAESASGLPPLAMHCPWLILMWRTAHEHPQQRPSPSSAPTIVCRPSASHWQR